MELEITETVLPEKKEATEYDDVTEREWVEYEFATIEYDFQIHPKAATGIRLLFDRLSTDQ